MRDQSGHIGSKEILPHADAQDQGTCLAYGAERIRRVRAEDAQRVGTLQSGRRLHDGGFDIPVVILFQQMDDGLRVRLALEHIAVRDQLLAQGEVVLDDPVVHDGKAPVIGQMGVGVDIRGRAVGRPAGVPDADAAGNCRAVFRLFAELGDTSAHFFDPNPVIVHHGDARRVISPVFQLLQPLQQDGRGTLFSGKSNDSAHDVFLLTL